MKLWTIIDERTVATVDGSYIGLADNKISAINFVRAHNHEVMTATRSIVQHEAAYKQLEKAALDADKEWKAPTRDNW